METTLAALLHDIGKFYQRTGYKLEDNDFYQQFQTLKGSYGHASYTAQFIDKFIKDGFKSFLVESADHHTSVDNIVKKADHIASGHDRKSNIGALEQDESEIEHQNNASHFTKRLISIFNEVSLGNEKNKPYYVPLLKLNDYNTQSELPSLDRLQSQAEYKKMFDEMVSEIKNIPYSSYEELHHFLYPILKNYTVTIPANTFSEIFSSVSLFDHMKLTTAIANCLKRTQNEEKPFVFIEYDLSGIQSFIYRITEGVQTKKNISKLLRTRSLYLNVLSDFIAYAIIHNFNLTYENVLYSSGGKGMILAPNINNFEDQLSALNERIERSIFEKHNGDISFSIAYNEATVDAIKNSEFKKLMSFDTKRMIAKKSQKFLSVLLDPSFQYVKPPISNLCKLCERNDAKGKENCSFCNNLLELNDQILAKSDNFIVEFDYENNNQTLADFDLSIGELGSINFYLSEKITPKPHNYYISYNSNFIGETKSYAKSNISGISFEEIAQKGEGDTNKLAVIKMDVDSLGLIFYKGIKQDAQTTSKILTLSRFMDYFFSKRVMEICRMDKFKNALYIIYSGGDDLAIIAPASMSLDLVFEINKEFEKFTGNNKSFHLSTGIEIFNAKSPIRFAIERSERQLAKAKNTPQKQSVGVLGQVISNSELERVIKEIEEYKIALDNKEISRSGLYNIYMSIVNSLEHTDRKKMFYRYIPQLAYSIKRNIKDPWFTRLKNTFIRNDIDLSCLELYKVIFGYALMKTRGD